MQIGVLVPDVRGGAASAAWCHPDLRGGAANVAWCHQSWMEDLPCVTVANYLLHKSHPSMKKISTSTTPSRQNMRDMDATGMEVAAQHALAASTISE